MVVHFGNAAPQTAKCTIDYLKANRLTRGPHPVISPDLARSYFSLFGKLQMSSMGAAFANDDEPLQGVMVVPNGIWREELEAVHDEWLRRLDRCIQQNLEYVE
jgi:hypothetical protein